MPLVEHGPLGQIRERRNWKSPFCSNQPDQKRTKGNGERKMWSIERPVLWDCNTRKRRLRVGGGNWVGAGGNPSSIFSRQSAAVLPIIRDVWVVSASRSSSRRSFRITLYRPTNSGQARRPR